jgi:membrane fusion protein (multidrug efflux system)
MKKILLLLLALIVVGGAWYYLKQRGAPAAEEAKEKPAAKVETTALKEQPIAQTIEVFGLVAAAPSAERVFAAPYDCVIRKISVSAGSAVGAGDVLMELDPSPDAKLAFDSSRSLLGLATKALAATQERYDLKLATSQDLLAAQQTAEDAKLKAASLEARGVSGDGRLVTMAGGIVSKLELSAGALVAMGTPLITITTGTQLEARLGVEPSDADSVAAGQPVSLESANRAAPEKFPSTVRIVGAALDAFTGAIEVRVPVPADASLRLGTHVRATIEIGKKENALVVPRSAVLPDDDKQVLFTVKAGKAVKHEVKLGLTTDELIEVIAEGLHAGDAVVTLGNYELEDGMAVQTAPTEEKKAEPTGAKDEAKAGAKPTQGATP